MCRFGYKWVMKLWFDRICEIFANSANYHFSFSCQVIQLLLAKPLTFFLPPHTLITWPTQTLSLLCPQKHTLKRKFTLSHTLTHKLYLSHTHTHSITTNTIHMHTLYLCHTNTTLSSHNFDLPSFTNAPQVRLFYLA